LIYPSKTKLFLEIEDILAQPAVLIN
jgi:hypothetical protein